MPTIRKRNGRWQAQVRIKQGGVIVFQKTATFDTERQARHWGVTLEGRVEREGAERLRESDHTITTLLLAYAGYREKLKPLSRGMQHSIREWLQAPFADKPFHRVTAQDYVAWGTTQGQRVKPATVTHHFMVLRSAVNMAPALIGSRLNAEPLLDAAKTLRHVRVMGKSEARDRRVSDAELGQIIQCLMGKFLTVPTHTFVRLAVALPRRREELLTMCWDDYDGKTVVLRDTKNPHRSRTEVVPVPPEARAIIDSLPRHPGEARILPYRPESVSAAFQRAVREVGLEDIRLHDLRHEGISRLFEQGLSIQEVALISGHLSWSALRRYTHLKPLDVVEKLHARSQGSQKTTAEPKRP